MQKPTTPKTVNVIVVLDATEPHPHVVLTLPVPVEAFTENHLPGVPRREQVILNIGDPARLAICQHAHAAEIRDFYLAAVAAMDAAVLANKVGRAMVSIKGGAEGFDLRADFNLGTSPTGGGDGQ